MGEAVKEGDGSGFAPPPSDVLVVDDDEAVVLTLRRLLEQEGFGVRTALTRGEALRALDVSLPAAVVVDVLLPDGSGYSFVEELRARPGGDQLAVLMISVRTGLVDHVEAIHCGSDSYFEKPVSWDALIQRLTYLMNRRRGEPARILAVEDDERQAAYFKALLEAAGHEVRVCAHPRKFQSALAAFHPDLVLMDVLLPGSMRGHDLVRYLRSSESYATLPVVFLTAEEGLASRIDGAAAGGDDYLVKPVPNALLLQTVAARVERARFLRSLLERDGLTRLLNQEAFQERTRAAVARQRQKPGRLAWVLIDVDQMQAVNDRFGHPAGDRVLGALAALLRRRLRQSHVVGRLEGAQVAVLLEGLGEGEAVRLVERLREEFSATDQKGPDGSTFRVSFSAGVAMLGNVAWTGEAWKKAAREALGAAKTAGRGLTMPYSQAAGVRPKDEPTP